MINSLTFCRFSLRQKTKDENGEFETMEVTVYDYFVNYRKMDLRYSGDLPCINVGKPKKPIFLPIEVQIVYLSFKSIPLLLCAFY